ncbi:hypothetical protein [Wenzhouxiangella sp. EGI_FJ10409]|uniref:hypothetical protein n=1 Tax=Wenzhouxiangella sp. EGI_FJ10409 TaxID=3243767 RepID=UPI0035D94236
MIRTLVSISLFSIAFSAMLGTPLITSSAAGEMPGDWRLPGDYRAEARMPMHLVHPRNAESAEWAIGKNAHPGVRWEIPVVVQGGAWPFRYEIIDNGGAEGLAIGGELERVRDDGFILHRVTDDYGRVWWNDPQAGQYEILLRVTDQALNTIDVPISLTVGTDGWVFVDADTGDDANDGSVDAPFRTVQRIHDGGAQFEDHRVYLAGTVGMDGNRTNGNLRIAAGSGDDTPAPAVWVGWPGRGGVLEAYEGNLVIDHEDFYLGNLEHRHRADFFQDEGEPIHMMTAWSGTDRLTLHDVHFSRFQGNASNVGLGNSSIIMFTDPDFFRDNVAVVNNRMSGDNGIFTSAYRLRHAVFENNRAAGAHFNTGDSATWALFWMKRYNENITLRANHFGADNQWGGQGNLAGALGLSASRSIEFAFNTLHSPYDPESSRGGALKMFTNGSLSYFTWTEETPVWLYRNSLRQGVDYEGGNLANMPGGNIFTQRNVSSPAPWPQHVYLSNSDNLDGDDYFDAGMNLKPPHREPYLGRYGAEIAEPDIGQVFRDRFESGW